MADRRVVRVDEIADTIAMGPFGSNIKVETFQSAGIPIISGGHLHEVRLTDGDFNFISVEHADRLGRSNVRRGDVVFTHAGNIGQVSYIPQSSKYERYVVSQRQFYLRCNELACPRYIAYYFRSSKGRHDLLANASQVGVPSIARPASYLRSIKINLPSIGEQRAIADVLTLLDDKIELNRRMNETLEAMAHAILRDWFVDFGPTQRKIDGVTDPVEIMGGLVANPDRAGELADLFPASFGNDGLPQGWEAVAASTLIEFNPSEPLKKGTLAPYSDMGSVPTIGSLAEPPVKRAFGSGMRFRNGDALLARITPCLENGKAAYVDFLPDKTVGWGSTEFIVLRAKPPLPRPFAYLLVRLVDFRDRAIRSMTGTSGRQRVQAESLTTFLLPRAPAEVYKVFGSVVEPLFDLISANGRQNRTLAATRDLLLPKLMSGEILLHDAEGLLEAAQ